MGGSGADRSARIRHTFHIGEWGNPYEGGGVPGKGVVSYGVSPNRLRPFQSFFTKGIFNSVRRVKNQIFYIVPPFVVAYYSMQWAIERNEYLNSKAGRAEFGSEE